MAAVTSVSVKGTLDDGAGPRDFALLIKQPSLVVCTTTDAQGRPVCTGRDPQGRFWCQDRKGVRDLEGDRAGELMGLVLALFPAGQVNLAERLASAVTEVEVLEGRPAVAIGRRGVPGPYSRLVFDEETSLLARIGGLQLDNYRPVGNLRQPHCLRINGVTYRIADLRHHEDLADDRFRRPGATRGWRGLLPLAMLGAPEPRTLLSATGKLEIVRQPPPCRIQIVAGRMKALPKFDPNSGRHAQVDLRGCDLTGLDLTDRLGDLLHADYDSNTRWPERLPAEFELARIRELGVDPGLKVRELHRRGLRGQGIGIGIIDQPLLVNHREYAGRLRLYEEIHSPGGPAQMHGPAVASIAVGATCGVAPEADLYYIAEQHGTAAPGGEFEWDFRPLAQSIHRLLDVNAALPRARRLRVISISVGWAPGQKGYDEAMAAVERASRERVFVVSTSLRQTHKLTFDGLDRDPRLDGNLPASYGPGSWWAPAFWSGQRRFKPGERLCVPMDSRTLASPTGPEDYVHYGSAGWSWVVPWVSGLFALACQVDPEITPERFWAEALATGDTITVKNETEETSLGTIADPVELMRKLGWPGRGTTPEGL